MPPRNRVDPAPDRFEFERTLLERGVSLIAGVDEAGRGPLAGPVIAAAVMFPKQWIRDAMPAPLKALNDSKQLSEHRREALYEELMRSPGVVFGIAACEASVIDEINILQATHRAMNLALEKLSPGPQHALVDGRPVTTLRWEQTAIVKGDSKSYSIAAASILAKVTRDREMLEWDRRHPEYGFAIHKGYGTPQHLAAIRQHGPCPIHRLSFAPLKPGQAELF